MHFKPQYKDCVGSVLLEICFVCSLEFIFLNVCLFYFLFFCRQESPKPLCTAAAMLCSPAKCMELPGNTKHPETLSDANRFQAVIEKDKLSMSPSRLQTDTVLPQTCKLHIISLGMPSDVRQTILMCMPCKGFEDYIMLNFVS